MELILTFKFLVKILEFYSYLNPLDQMSSNDVVVFTNRG